MRKNLLAFICLFVFTIQFSAQDNQNTELIEQLTQNRRTMKLENNQLVGDGARFLLDEAKSSQFFLVGEDHGIADMPIFTAALFRAVNSFGYQNFATETGPLTAVYLEKMSSNPQAQTEFANFNRQYPFGLPFYYWQEEAQMIESIVKTSRSKNPVLWGLDQEFIESPAFHFKRLIEIAPNKEAKMTANEYYEKTKDEMAQIVKSKNPGLAFLSSAKTEDFDKLDAAFKSDSNKESKMILSELRESWEIYQKNFMRRGYESNLQRSLLMKRHFMAYYNEALGKQKSPPKVLFKFGANHVKRGKNYTNVYDIGNMVAELAASNNSTSFHLFAVPLGGTQNKYLPFLQNDADKQKKIEITEDSGEFDARILLEIAGTKDWTVVDLRPLRPLIHSGKLKQLPKGFDDLIWGYDAILLMPDVKAATLFE